MPPSCALLGGFTIGARVAWLWQHNANPSYKLASIRQYDDIVRTRNVSECSVLALCLVLSVFCFWTRSRRQSRLVRRVPTTDAVVRRRRTARRRRQVERPQRPTLMARRRFTATPAAGSGIRRHETSTHRRPHRPAVLPGS